MADIKALKDAVWLKKEAIKKEEAGLAEWQAQAQKVDELIEGGAKDMDEFKQEIMSAAAVHEAALARLRPQLAELEAKLPTTPKPAAPKFDPEKHPLLRKANEKLEPEKPVAFSPGDIVEAQWTDRSWYKAKIQSVLGSASAPKYLVRFIEYDDSITVDGNAIRLLPHKRKRDTEPAVAPPSAALPVSSNPHVISGPASINPNSQSAKKNVAEEEVKPKSRIANKGQLKKRKENWADFQAKVNKKMPIKESMFRTSTEAGSRVGFTGSGKGMTETHKRTRYNHKADAENDEEFKEAVSRGPPKRF